jgi:hypothetical protein
MNFMLGWFKFSFKFWFPYLSGVLTVANNHRSLVYFNWVTNYLTN